MNRFRVLFGVHTRGLIRQNFVCDKIMCKRLSNLAKDLTLYFESELSIQVGERGFTTCWSNYSGLIKGI